MPPSDNFLPPHGRPQSSGLIIIQHNFVVVIMRLPLVGGWVTVSSLAGGLVFLPLSLAIYDAKGSTRALKSWADDVKRKYRDEEVSRHADTPTRTHVRGGGARGGIRSTTAPAR